jgi:hypothetical protein
MWIPSYIYRIYEYLTEQVHSLSQLHDRRNYNLLSNTESEDVGTLPRYASPSI